MHFGRAGGDEQTGGAGVEAVHEARRQRIADVAGLRIASDEVRRGGAALARIECVRGHAPRLIEHDEVLVLVHDGHCEVGLGSKTRGQVGERDDGSRGDAGALGGSVAVDAHRALGDERAHQASRQPGKRRPHDGVEPAGDRDGDHPLPRARAHELWRAGSTSAARFSRTSS